MIKRSWVEINLKTIATNYCIYKQQLPSSVDVMAVVKADAYGHGEIEVAHALQDVGCVNFAVSNIEEAVSLRKNGISGQILILGYTPPILKNALLKYDITQALISVDYAKELAGYGIKAQFVIDTGMNRIGINGDDPEQCAWIIRYYSQFFNLTGMFTHLSVADDENENLFTISQIEKIKRIASLVKDLNLKFLHCMNSAGGLNRHLFWGNMVRLGIILYGLKPNTSFQIPAGITSALEWKSIVSLVKKVHPGESIGYGRSFMANKEMLVATIPTGYADGFRRELSNKGFVFIHGEKANIVGKVCMDQFMVDVTGIPNVKFEDEVVLLGKDHDADEVANEIGTIGYEIICQIGKRVPRVYI